ncbi:MULTISPECIES: hypothetical protein [Winslowiella]|nr:hypothetical protein [Winslowiella toletana]WNN45976.1 hypothetical protein RIN69_09025 [Winslowiella toletana]
MTYSAIEKWVTGALAALISLFFAAVFTLLLLQAFGIPHRWPCPLH